MTRLACTFRTSLAAVALTTLLAGCALFSKGASVKLRYFAIDAAGEVSAPAAATSPAKRLRLGRVVAALYLRDRIAYRIAGTEVSFYNTLRWAEPPEDVVERSVARALFATGAAQEIVSGVGPTLDIELEAFDEVMAPAHVARVVISWRLRGDRTVLAQRTVAIDHAIVDGPAADAGNAIALAMSLALRTAVTQLATTVVAALPAAPPVPAVTP